MIAPKIARACSCCDGELAEVRVRAPDGRPVRAGGRPAGSKIATWIHLDGRTSEHSLCADCTLDPEQLPALWARALLAYAKGIDRDRPRAAHEAYAENVPLGILHIRTVGEVVA